jgi:oligoendopeptidase F
MSETTLLPRAAVPPEHTWDLESVYADDAAWEAGAKRLLERMPAVQAYQGRLGEGPGVLAECLALVHEVSNDADQLLLFAEAAESVDTTDQAAAARLGRARTILAATRAAVAFVEPEIAAIGFPTLRAWPADGAELATYAHYLDDVERRAAHLRSAEVEEVLGMAADAFATANATHGVLANAELPFAPARGSDPERRFEVAQGTLGALVSSPDREVRRTAWESYADAHLAFKNTMANCLVAGMKQQVFRARVRRFGSALEGALTPNNIPVEVFHNLIAAFRKHLPTWHRYWRVRRAALGLDVLREYDVKAPLTAQKPAVHYAQAVEWICRGMAPLGEEYVSILRRGCTEERWVDIYPNKGKGQGAYSTGTAGMHPFIFLNYNDDLFSMSTLAHELGHSLHSYMTWRAQPLVYADYSIFVAEVASNFNQALVRDYLFRTYPERDFQIAVIEEAMSNFHRYFFIMPTLARFEMEMHGQIERGQTPTAESMSGLMADLFAEGYGGGLAMDHARTGITWAQFSTHLYYNFYVYQYATGISAAHALAGKVLAGEEGAAARYLEFLSAGSSLYPLDALRRAGVDMLTPEPVEAAFGVLAGLVDRLEKLLGV